jgi:hypothetical protein
MSINLPGLLAINQCTLRGVIMSIKTVVILTTNVPVIRRTIVIQVIRYSYRPLDHISLNLFIPTPDTILCAVRMLSLLLRVATFIIPTSAVLRRAKLCMTVAIIRKNLLATCHMDTVSHKKVALHPIMKERMELHGKANNSSPHLFLSQLNRPLTILG